MEQHPKLQRLQLLPRLQLQLPMQPQGPYLDRQLPQELLNLLLLLRLRHITRLLPHTTSTLKPTLQLSSHMLTLRLLLQPPQLISIKGIMDSSVDFRHCDLCE